MMLLIKSFIIVVEWVKLTQRGWYRSEKKDRVERVWHSGLKIAEFKDRIKYSSLGNSVSDGLSLYLTMNELRKLCHSEKFPENIPISATWALNEQHWCTIDRCYQTPLLWTGQLIAVHRLLEISLAIIHISNFLTNIWPRSIIFPIISNF